MTRSLAPREHGAYGQLLFPLLVAHLTALPTAAGWLFTTAFVAAFVAHEPCLVLLGRRGSRAGRELSVRARWLLAGTVAVGASAAVAGFTLAPPVARHGLLFVAGLATPAVALMLGDRERTLAGEVYLGATLPAMAVPVALAGGVDPARALAAWAVFALGTMAATGAVRAIVTQLRRPMTAAARVALPIVALLVAGIASALSWLDTKAIVALVPVLEVSGVAALMAPHPRHLRRVGWTLVAATLVTAVLLSL